MDRNLGASQAATAFNDADSYGDLFQWGRFADGHQCRASNTTGTLSSSSTPGSNLFITVDNPPFHWQNITYDDMWQGLYGANNPCPDGYRIPTEAEWNIERNSFGQNNSTGAFESPLKLPVSGFRNLSSGDEVGVGSVGIYWSNSVSNATVITLDISDTTGMLGNYRALGAAVRCLKDLSPPSYPVNYVHCFENGNTTEIVEVYNPLTDKTWMDRNLGASQAASSKNDANSYGDLFQWGRFADGHQCRDSDTLATLASSAFSFADSAWYGKFIKAPGSPYSWLESSLDTNLWLGTRSLNNPCPGGYRLPTDAEWNEERESWSENNSTGAFNSPLKLPVSGFRRDSDGKLIGAGSLGYYWSSSSSSTSSTEGYLNFIVSNANVSTNFLANGISVRCLKN
jgi:hypothetical protein